LTGGWLLDFLAISEVVTDVAVIEGAGECVVITTDSAHLGGPVAGVVLRLSLGRDHLVLLNGDPLVSIGDEPNVNLLAVFQ
jgi:hypothetical protein